MLFHARTPTENQEWIREPLLRRLLRVGALVCFCLGLAATAHAQSGLGAETVQRGRWAVGSKIGIDTPETVLFNIGAYYGATDRVQIGFEIATISAGLSVKTHVLRSDDGAFQLSALASIRGFYLPDDQRSDGLLDNGFDGGMNLEPRLIAEWGFGEEQRWGVAAEIGSTHFYGHYDRKVLANGGDDDPDDWSHGLRATLGINYRFNEGWALGATGGVFGGSSSVAPVFTVGFTKSF